MEGEYTIDDQDIPYQKKIDLWETGFGLQAVDGLKPSDYMVSLAKENIAGKLTYEQVDTAIKHYHEHEDATTKEADIVSLRITELLSRKGFVFSPATLKSIHRTLFFDVFSDFRIKIGDYRQYNISKSEPILEGKSVSYADYAMIFQTLDYDFSNEKSFDYSNLDKPDIIAHIQKFISAIWQIHPFGEGNTRTITVFLIKYLEEFGYQLNNDPFKKYAKYFRDALVLDNASRQFQKTLYLKHFFENLLLSTEHDLSLDKMYQEVLGVKDIKHEDKE